MAHIQEVMATGVTSTLARMLGSNRLRTVVAQGSAQEDATPLVSNFCLLACPVPGQGVRLNRAREAAITALFAIGPDAVLIYPAEDEAINNLAPDQPVALQPGSALLAVPSRDHWLMVLSAAEGGIADAPADGGPWAREGGEWVELPPPLPEAPENGVLYGRQDASWQPVAGGGGGGGVAGVTAGTGLLVNGVPGATITTVGTMALDVPVSVAHGGTGAVAAGGAALDNISGLAGLGFVERTGSAVYGVVADPLPVAKGGTGTASGTGQGLDNITGLTGTGLVERTGGGSYTVVPDPLPVTRGGTAANAPGGQALDNISGFATTGFVQRIGAGAYSLVPGVGGVTSITATGGLAANGVAGGSITTTGIITVAAGPPGAVLGFGAGGTAVPSAALAAGHLVKGGGTSTPIASAAWSEDANHTLAANLNTGAVPGSSSAEPGIYIAGPDGTAPALSGDSFGASGLRLIGRRAQGTAALPGALSDSLALVGVNARGYTGAAFGTADQASLTLATAENWGPAANGTKARVFVTPRGSISQGQALAVQADGTLYVGASSSSTANNTGAGTVNAADYYRANVRLGLANGMGDVTIAGPAGGDLLTYNSGTGKWVNAPAVTGGGGTVTHTAGALAAQAVMLGNTGADAKTSATWTEDVNKTLAANFNTVAGPGPDPAAPGLYLAGPDGAGPALSGDGFAGVGLRLIGRRSEGSAAIPSPPADGAQLVNLGGRGYTSAAFGAADQAQIALQAAELWASLANGARIRFSVTQQGSTTLVQAGAFQADGTLYVGSTISSTSRNTGIGTVNANNGYYLNSVKLGLANMGDVAIGSPAGGEVLTWSSGAGKWINLSPATGGGGTVTHISGVLAAQALTLGNGGADVKTSGTWAEDANKTLAANFNTVAVPGSNSAEPGLYLAGPDSIGPAVSGDGFGGSGLRLIGRRANGTAALPTALPDSITMTAINARGHNGAGFGASDQAQIVLQTAELWGVGTNGTKARVMVTPQGSTILTQAAAFQADGTLYVGSSISSTSKNTGIGTVNANNGYFVNNVALAAVAETLTNKTLSGASNTLSAIGNASLSNSSMTIAGNAVSLGGTLAAATLAASLPAMVGANGSAGVKGLVPAPSAGDAAAQRFLKADGTWSAPAGAGNVSASGTLAANQITLGAGGTGVQTLGALGTATQVLHGNASGAPTFGAVSLNTDVTGTLQAAQHPALTGDVTTSAGSLATLLATVNANVGTFQGLTVNAKGLVTAAANQSYLTANQPITLSGDVAGSGTTAIAVTLAAVTNAKLATMPAHSFKGNNTGTAGTPLDLTAAQLAAELAAVTHTGGALTAGAVMLGNGSGDAKVSATWLEDANHTLAANLNGGSVPGANSADAGLYIAGATGNAPALSGDGFAASGLRLIGRRAEGTLAVPSPPTDVLALTSITARGYTGSAFATTDQGAVVLTAAGNWGSGAYGTRIRFNTTPIGGSTLTFAGAFEADGTLYVGATSSTTAKNTGAGTVNADTGYFVNGTALSAVSETLTNKTISGASNTITAIGNASLSNSSMTIAGNAVSLGGTLSATTLAASLPAMVGANGTAGTKGLVPAPSIGDAAAGRFLKADGTWSAPAGSGNVSAAGTLTANQLTLGSGGTGVQTLGALGTTIQVLHGNAAGPPTFGAVNLASDVSGTLQAAQHPALTGDVTSSAGSLATTLATVNANAGTFQGLTVNAKGLVTAAANQSYLTGNQAITLSGDASGSGTTAIAVTLAAVTNAKLQTMAAHTYKGNNTGSTAAPLDLSISEVVADLNAVTHSAGALTSQALMLGNGSADAKVSATWVEDANHMLSANFNTGAVPGPDATVPGVYLGAADSVGPGVTGDAFGGTGLRLIGRRANGTLASQSTLPDSVTMSALNARGYNGSSYTGDQAQVVLQTAELWGGSANGTKAKVMVTPAGSTTLGQVLAVQSDGTLYVGTSVSSTSKNTGVGTVNANNGYYLNNLKVSPGTLQVTQATPSNPTGTSNTATGLMMGCAVAITPQATTRIYIAVCGDIFNSNAVGNGATVQIRYGTGTAPINGAAVTGTAVGAKIAHVSATTAQKAPFSLNAMVTGLTAGTPYWVDLAVAATTGGTATVENLSATLFEL